MPKLLMVTYHFPPSAAVGSFRLLGFARHLPKFGWRVGVVAPPAIPYEPIDQDLAERVPPEAKVYSCPYSVTRLNKPLRKLFPYACWVFPALATARRAIRDSRPDALLTSGPPHCVHLVGALLKRMYGIPWVADFRDPFVTGQSPQVRLRWGEPWLERLVIREADAIVWNAKEIGDVCRAAYPAQSDKMVIINNGFDPENYPPRSHSPGEADPVEIVHAGSLYAGRDPRPFLDALRSLGEDDGLVGKYRGIFLGESQEFDLRSEAESRGLGVRVSVEGHLPYPQALQRMIDADILLLIDFPWRRNGVPAKLYEYIGAGRPILALSDRGEDVTGILSECGVPHQVVGNDDTPAIRRALIDLAAQRGFRRMSNDIQFTRESMTKKLASILERCLGDVGQAGGLDVGRDPTPGPP